MGKKCFCSAIDIVFGVDLHRFLVLMVHHVALFCLHSYCLLSNEAGLICRAGEVVGQLHLSYPAMVLRVK